MREGDLTIYGPPGTGKSQTITNLIAAAMDTGRSVLFVAEKLTALDVVHKRLAEAGLDPYCFVLHSRGVRRSAVLDALRQRVDAAPPDFDESTYPTHRKSWESRRDALRLYASIESIAEVKRATTLLADNAELSRKFDLEPLARDDARLAVIAAADAAKAASLYARTLREEFDLDPGCLPPADDVRAIAGEAFALDCVQLSARELGAVAEKNRRKADAAVRVRSALEGLRHLFGISESGAGTVRITVRAMKRVRQTSRPILLARTERWVEERAHKHLAELHASVEEVRLECEALTHRFDVHALPSAGELRAAGRRLESTGRLWWLSRRSRRAAKLHREVRSEEARTAAHRP